jgi:hypothetical protein
VHLRKIGFSRRIHCISDSTHFPLAESPFLEVVDGVNSKQGTSGQRHIQKKASSAANKHFVLFMGGPESKRNRFDGQQ